MDKALKLLINNKRGTIGTRRIAKYHTNTKTLEKLAGEPIDDVLGSMDKVKKLSEKIDLSDYQAWTKSDFRLMLKMLWKAVNGYDNLDNPKEIRWLKVGVARKDKKHPKEVSEADLQKMLKIAGVRDRAILMLLYEAGLRPSELLCLKKSELEFVKEGVQVSIPPGTKTGARTILVVDAEPFLANWINAHPLKKADGLLFPSEYGTGNFRQMTVENLNKTIKTLARRAGVTRRIKTYDMRHTSANINATYMTEPQLREYYGWTDDSVMTATYVQVKKKDVDTAKLKHHNKPVEIEAEKSKTAPKVCKRCNKTNMHDAEMCSYCGLSFDKEKAKSDMLTMQTQLAVLLEEQKRMKKEMEQLVPSAAHESVSRGKLIREAQPLMKKTIGKARAAKPGDRV